MDEIINIVDNLEEFDRIGGGGCRYDFPAVTITGDKNCRTYAAFNAMCNPLCKKYAQLKMSDNYVFFRFTDVEDRRYYKVVKNNEEEYFCGFRICSMHLNRASLIGKSFKLYKYKDGYLINVREPLNGEADK